MTGDRAEDLVLARNDNGQVVFWDVGQGPAGFSSPFRYDPATQSPGPVGDLVGDVRQEIIVQRLDRGQYLYFDQANNNFGDVSALAGLTLLGVYLL